MLKEDPSRTHVESNPALIAALYEGTNQPLVQPHGRAAQSASAVVVAVRAAGGLQVLVGLHLVESKDNVVYAGDPAPEAQLPVLLQEGVEFAESMGFILDASGWSGLDTARRGELIDRLPVFRAAAPKEAGPVQRQKAGDPLAAVARLFAAFSVLFFVSCSGLSAEQRSQAAEIHQQLGDNLLRENNAQEALKEYLQSIDMEETPEARLGLGLINAWSLGRTQEGEKEFKRALELRPDYAEALTNLGALYISRERFAEAVPLLSKASRDPLYKARVLAQSNLGWALYKSGQADKGVSEIRGALQVAPKYCLGWRQLGTIFSEQGKLDDASDSFGKYAEACPDVADAHLSFGKVLVRRSKAGEARAEFQQCAVPRDDKDKPVAAECAKYLRELGQP